MTNCQGEKSNSRPTDIASRFELGVPVLVTWALTTIPIGYLQNQKAVYNRNTRKRDTKVYRGIPTYIGSRLHGP